MQLMVGDKPSRIRTAGRQIYQVVTEAPTYC